MSRSRKKCRYRHVKGRKNALKNNCRNGAIPPEDEGNRCKISMYPWTIAYVLWMKGMSKSETCKILRDNWGLNDSDMKELVNYHFPDDYVVRVLDVVSVRDGEFIPLTYPDAGVHLKLSFKHEHNYATTLVTANKLYVYDYDRSKITHYHDIYWRLANGIINDEDHRVLMPLENEKLRYISEAIKEHYIESNLEETVYHVSKINHHKKKPRIVSSFDWHGEE